VDEQRAVLIVVMLLLFPFGLYHRIKSQSTGERLDRRQEGLFILATLRPLGLVFWLSLWAWMINPAWMAWSSVSLPNWSRWIGVGVLLTGVALLVWTFRSLGSNLTDTVVTRKQHTLVVHGPYRWIRHPLYSAAGLVIPAVSLIAANWFFFVLGITLLGILIVRTRTEEANLVVRFGDRYQNYMDRTGRFVPRILAFVICAGALASVGPMAQAQRTDAVPLFEVDAAWPKALPNNWAVGPVSGISTDARDHIWIIHRGEAVTETGRVPAPPVIEFDPAGNVVQTWGGPGPGYDWPQQVHGITVDDANGRVWITGNGEKDTHILAFTRAGKFLRQIGRSGMTAGSNNTANVARATQVRVDARAREIFVSDGEQNQNHRVIVFDSETGAYKRHWGAFGEKPDDAAIGTDSADRQFGSAVHCVRIDRDNRVYVCDRSHSRVQIFRKDGTFENTVSVPRVPGSTGTVYDLDFSPDQKFVYIADGANQRVWILRRDEMRIVDWFGERGAGPGQFATSLHDLAVDSKGNIFTGEAAAAGRVQKFARRALPAVVSVRTLSAGARDAITNLVLNGGHDDINPATYPEALRSEIRQYLKRSTSYRSTRRLPKDADGVAEMSHSRNLSQERRLAASTADPRATRAAVAYVDALQPCYEWEGMPDCPEEEAIFADKYQLEHPDGPFREVLPLFAAHLWLCTAEFSRPDSERAARARREYERDIAIATKSSSLLIRTGAEGLKARGRCYSP